MEDNANILKELQHLEVQPPGELYSAVWNAISGESNTDTYSPIPDLATTTPETKITTPDVPVQFSQLKDYIAEDAQPPSFEEVLQKKETVLKLKDRSGLQYNWRKIAAIFVLVLTAGTLFYVYNSKRNKSNEALASNLKANSTIIDSSALNDHSKNHGNDKKKVNRDDIEFSTKASTRISKNVSTSFIDSDFIYLLTSFNPETAELFMQDMASKSVIYLNRFSYVNISDKMREFLETMYKTKHNKKPTRKAKKARQKLEKWKKADENYFDNGAGKNPLDILDLSEFILQ